MIGHDIISFCKKGGRIRLICSPSMAPEDVAIIAQSYEEKERDAVLARSVEADLDALLAIPEANARVRLLGVLVGSGHLEIRLAIPSSGNGIFHSKVGIFSDVDNNQVGFIGSSNETWNGWHPQGNREAVEVFRSWSPSDGSRARRQADYFEELWGGVSSGVTTINFPAAAKMRLLQASGATSALLDDELVSHLADLSDSIHAAKRHPNQNQLAAISAWKAAGGRGIFVHATGSGKTFTAIQIIKEHLLSEMPVIVLVPSALLLKQWALEIYEECPDATVLLAGDGRGSWKNNRLLQKMTMESSAGKRIVLAMMQTASSDLFLDLCQENGDILLVADEVHQLGSDVRSKILSKNFARRLGLSATPIRYGDPVGTAKILDYFGGPVGPVITLKDSIASGRLVPYYYHPHAVELTGTETQQWNRLTKAVVSEWGKKDNCDHQKLKLLLIRRSQVAKKAVNKIALAQKIIVEHFSTKSWWLVYCEDAEQLASVIEALQIKGFHPLEYHSALSADQRTSVLSFFESEGGILCCIRCLDEGVDIPLVDHALILASSKNPRQFIQRRGRTLRASPGKRSAEIHDAIIVPKELEETASSPVVGELLRAISFAKDAENRSAEAGLRKIAIAHNIDIDSDMWKTIENEGENDE